MEGEGREEGWNLREWGSKREREGEIGREEERVLLLDVSLSPESNVFITDTDVLFV